MFDAFTKWVSSVAQSTAVRFTLPRVVYEIAPGFVAGVRLDGSGRKARRVRDVSVERIKPPTLDPHLSRPNVADGEDLLRATTNLMFRVSNGGGPYGLLVPDGAVRAAVLTFETLPDDGQEAEALIRWRMKDKLPYNSEEARAAFQVLSRETGQVEVLAIAIRAAVLAEYVSALAPSDGGAALVLPATAALLPLLTEADPRGQILLHVCSNWVTAVVVAGSRPCVWRTRELDPAAPETHTQEVASEAMRVLASASDRLQADLGRVWLCARPPAGRALASTVAAMVGREVELMAPRTDLSSLLSTDDRAIFEEFGAPVAGLVANVA